MTRAGKRSGKQRRTPAPPAPRVNSKSSQAALSKPQDQPRRPARLWPFEPRTSLAATLVCLLLLVTLAVLLKTRFRWPGNEAESALLIGILVISVAPIALAITDIIIERGGVIQFGDMRIDFSVATRTAADSLKIPANIGAGAVALTDSDTANILNALGAAVESKVAVIDLERGAAWWETRLLVLLAGADRLGTPNAIVFTATDHGRPRQFIGWACPSELLHQLVQSDPQYARSVAASRAAAHRWDLVEPSPGPGQPVPPPPSMPPGLATDWAWIARDPAGLPNPFLAEQILQGELGRRIESQGGGREISLVRLEALFRPLLRVTVLDLAQPPKSQIKALSFDEELYIAVTNGGDYVGLTSKVTLLCALLPDLTDGG